MAIRGKDRTAKKILLGGQNDTAHSNIDGHLVFVQNIGTAPLEHAAIEAKGSLLERLDRSANDLSELINSIHTHTKCQD